MSALPGFTGGLIGWRMECLTLAQLWALGGDCELNGIGFIMGGFGLLHVEQNPTYQGFWNCGHLVQWL
jgi:hypothetical protein